MALPDVVLFPRMMLPLFIFEPRYRQLVKTCLEGDRLFAVVLAEGDKPARSFGVGVLRTCVRNPDGTYHVLVEGLHRYRMLEFLESAPCFRVRAERMGSEENDSGGDDRQWIENWLRERADTSERAQTYWNYFQSQEKMNTGDFSDVIAAGFIGSADQRQSLLETASVEKRLTMLRQILDTF